MSASSLSPKGDLEASMTQRNDSSIWVSLPTELAFNGLYRYRSSAKNSLSFLAMNLAGLPLGSCSLSRRQTNPIASIGYSPLALERKLTTASQRE